MGEGIDHFILDIIGKVAGRYRAGKAAPAIINAFILGNGVEDQGHQATVFIQHFGPAQPGLAAHLRVRVRHHVHDLGFGNILPVNREPQAGGGFIKQPDPGRPPRGGPFNQHGFQFIGKLVLSPGPHDPEPG